MSASLMEIFEMSRLMMRAEIALKCCGYRNCLLRVVAGIEMCFRGLSVEILDHYCNPVRKINVFQPPERIQKGNIHAERFFT